ncbi:MAG: magnesium transporter [Pseudomonadota bacterium]|nr:MAG: magnesium transporter [Pseudomonadota bacterium]
MHAVTNASNIIEQIIVLLRADELEQAAHLLGNLHPAEIAHVLQSLPPEERELVWPHVPSEHEGEVLLHLPDDVRTVLISKMEPQALVAATESLDTDDLADILPEMPQDVIQELLLTLEHQERERLESVLSYPEDSAGGLMDLETVVVRADITLDVVLRYLRWRGAMPETTDTLFVVNRDNKYLGLLPLTDLLTSDPDLTVAEIMRRDIDGIPADMTAREVAALFERRDLVTAPVVDENDRLLGRITIVDVVDVIRDEADHDFLSMAGLNEEADMFAPVVMSTRRRAVWLGINLLTALLASWVIGLFEVTIEKLVALAVLMPIVASMGGIAGSQTLTLVIRGLALGQISDSNARLLLFKELSVGVLNGLLWALVIAVVAGAWFENLQLSLVIALAVIINLVVAAIAGATIPLLLRRFGADPALAGGVVLTTITDVIGFFAFLGLAALYLV